MALAGRPGEGTTAEVVAMRRARPYASEFTHSVGVVVGLMIGNHGRALAMSDTTRRDVDAFWELLDEILNAVLFVLIGMEVTVISLALGVFAGALAALALTLLARADRRVAGWRIEGLR